MSVKNQGPEKVAANTLEQRIAVPSHHDATAGANAGSKANLFEQRCVQEVGTH